MIAKADASALSPRRSGLPGGIVGRELRVAAPLMGTLAILPALLPIVVKLGSAFTHGGFEPPSLMAFADAWLITGCLAAGIVGILCGAEEEESGTLEFVLAQPIHPFRILAEKIAGAGLALLVWAVCSLPLCAAFACFLAPELRATDAAGGNLLRDSLGRALPVAVPWLLFAFLLPLGVGVWVRRVIVTAVVSGVLWFGLFAVAATIVMSLGGEVSASFDDLAPVFLALCPLPLLSAIVRYGTRGMGRGAQRGRLGAQRGRLGGPGIFWKDWQERRAVVLCLTLLAAVAPLVVRLAFVWHPSDPSRILLLVPLWFASVVLGGAYYSRCEQEPADSFLETLPIYPRDLWRTKMLTLLSQWALPAVATFVVLYLVRESATHRVGEDYRLHDISFRRDEAQALTGLLFQGWGLALPLLLFSVCTRLHIRSTLAHLVATPILFVGVVVLAVVSIPPMPAPLLSPRFAWDPSPSRVVVVLLLCAAAIVYRVWVPRLSQRHLHLLVAMAVVAAFLALGLAGPSGTFAYLASPLLLAAALALWVRFAIARTRLREWSPGKRFAHLMIFTLALTEVYAVAVLCDWRDLAFLVLGV